MNLDGSANGSPFHIEEPAHRESTSLPCGNMGKGTRSTSFPLSERAVTSSTQGGTAMTLQVGRSKAQQTPPDQGSNPGIRSAARRVASGAHLACSQICGQFQRCLL